MLVSTAAVLQAPQATSSTYNINLFADAVAVPHSQPGPLPLARKG
jgi:hypothetical protein